jgi:hypothetical protein
MCVHHMREDIEGSYALEAGSTTPCHPHPGSKDGGLSRADRHRTPEPRTGRRPGPPYHTTRWVRVTVQKPNVTGLSRPRVSEGCDTCTKWRLSATHALAARQPHQVGMMLSSPC